jgi:uncharacterized repeat protein (TIGR03803 family)
MRMLKPSFKRLVTMFALLTLATAVSAQTVTFKTLYTFPGGANAANPASPLIFDHSGNLYGTSPEGGSVSTCGGYGCGTVFELAPSTPKWKEKLLFAFPANADPSGALARDAKGNFYGTTYEGGDPVCNCGQVYQLVHTAAGWTQNILHIFTSNGSGDGQSPENGLVLDAAGNLYGTTQEGGAYNQGTIFELTPNSDGTWTYSIIHEFNASTQQPSDPSGSLVIDAAGNIYGTAVNGGLYYDGAVYKLSFSGGAWTVTDLYNFTSDFSYFPYPYGLAMSSAGTLYGVTLGDGEFGLGTVYELTPTPIGYWTHTLLHTFTGASDGASPTGGPTINPSGGIYGTASSGGIFGFGTVYKLVPGTNGKWTYSVLHSFKNSSDGSDPYGGVILDSLGNLYGTALSGGSAGYGVAYEIVP